MVIEEKSYWRDLIYQDPVEIPHAKTKKTRDRYI